MDRLLHLLDQNAKLSPAQLAAMLETDEAAVEAAIAKYEKEGIIKGYQAIINWDKVEPEYIDAMIEIKVSPKKDYGFEEIARRILLFDEVQSVYLMSGGYDLAVRVTGKSFHDVALFVAQRLSPLDSVLSTATHFVLRRYKEKGIVLCEEEKTDGRSMVL